MAVKSVVDIDVDDAAFQRFSQLFSKYQDQLTKTPNVWKNVSKEAATASSIGGPHEASAQGLHRHRV